MMADLIVLGIAAAALSGIPALFMRSAPARGQRAAVLSMSAAMAFGLAGAVSVLSGRGSANAAILSPDALSAFFLVPVFLTGGLGSLYGLGYWPAAEHRNNAGKLQLFWGLLIAGMALLVTAKTAPSFLLGWEVMALSAFFLVSAEDHLAESRKAGWVYFVATHIGTLSLFALFAYWRSETGSFDLEPIRAGSVGPGAENALFFLALIGFGLKSGIMPLHFWLPGAHANAPSHVSALLSGVVLKMGVYGLVRWLSLIPFPPLAWGAVLLFLGVLSGLLGIIFAVGQRDVKRLLAYSSIENIGIIFMALGLALVGVTLHKPTWTVLGLAACLLHVWNHSFFKVLLFMGAGSIVHGMDTRKLDRMGGLAKTMPYTATMFLIGSLAVCGLPPLNGFIGESILYLGLLQGSLTALAVPALAMIGALALVGFVKAYGAIFLGAARTIEAETAHESPLAMKAAMAPFAFLCVAVGLTPTLVSPVLDSAIVVWSGRTYSTVPRVAETIPLGPIALASTLVALAIAASLILAHIAAATRRRSGALKTGTWDCGYAAPSPRMQYNGSSFSEPAVSFFAWLLRPRVKGKQVEGIFPDQAAMSSKVDDAVLDRVLMPLSRRLERRFRWVRRFQQGLAQQYLLYIFVAILILLGSLVPFKSLIARVFV